MTPLVLLSVYSGLILLASLAGGWIPLLVRLSHRRMELLLSFVSGVMLGVGVLHLLPHALMQRTAALSREALAVREGHELIDPVLWWLLAGFLAMFLIERFFCFHHHDPPEESDDHAHEQSTNTRHKMTWTGAAIGLGMHSLIEGVALAASVVRIPSDTGAGQLVGFGVFLAIVLHKPFDALSLGTLTTAGNLSRRAGHLLNGVFGLAVPLGVVGFLALTGVGGSSAGGGSALIAAALAFSAGTFLCISLTDLLPELQFHSHDRVKLTAALLLGLAVAAAAGRLETHAHMAAVSPQSLTDGGR